MRLAVWCLCFLHVVFVTGLVVRGGAPWGSGGAAKTPHRTGSLSQGRQKTLFSRRLYEHQRINVMKPKVLRPPRKEDPPNKVAQKPAPESCSQLGQSCLPQSGCCEPCGVCHCHFFNVICFCRRGSSQCKKKT